MKKGCLLILSLLFLVALPLVVAYDFCEQSVSNDDLEILEIIDSNQTSETNWSWEPNEQVVIEIKVKNKNFTTRDFKLELFFLDEDLSPKNITATGTSPIQTISLPKGDIVDLDFSFKLSDPNQDIYYLYAKLSDPSNESICTSLRATTKDKESTIHILPEEKILNVRKIVGPLNVTLGERVEYILEVINLGNLKEDKVLAVVYNSNLGIRETKEMGDIEAGAIKNVSLNFTIPVSATPQEEDFLFTVEYDYKESTGYYYQSAEKAKRLTINIMAIQEEVSAMNQTNETSQENDTVQSVVASQEDMISSQSQEALDDGSPSLLWVIVPAIFVIIILVAAYFWFKKSRQMPVNPATSATVNEYLEKIKGRSSNLSGKPFEMNTENTKTPQTSQNPVQQPSSPSRPEVTSSSLESNAAKSVEFYPVPEKKPQKNQPSPRSQDQDKTSSQ